MLYNSSNIRIAAATAVGSRIPLITVKGIQNILKAIAPLDNKARVKVARLIFKKVLARKNNLRGLEASALRALLNCAKALLAI